MGGPNSTSRLFSLRVLAVVALAGMMLLSGCAGKSNKKGATAPSEVVDPTYDDTTGAIHGTVLNEELIPLAGVDVGLQNDRLSTTTSNAAGEFGFSQVAPGDYVLLASPLGYMGTSKQITVQAGEVTDVQLDLVAQAVAGRPYAKVFGPISGRFSCGFGTGAVSGPCKVVGFADSSNPVEVTWQDVSGGENNIFEDRHIIEGNKSNPDDQLKSLVVEVMWTPTSAGARWMQAAIEDLPADEGARNTSEPRYARTSGASPLRMAIEPGVKDPTGGAAMPVTKPGFSVGVFPTVDPASPSVTNPSNNRQVLIGASAYTAQTFQLWYSLFYNAPAPTDYTALAA